MNEDDYNSGPLVVGKAVFEPRAQPVLRSDWRSEVFGGFPSYDKPCPIPARQIDVDEMSRDYETRHILVNKDTHRIRYESETEHEVTIVIEPK